MLDRNAAYADYSQRRMRQEFKELHMTCLELGDEMRADYGPSKPQSMLGKMDQTGGSAAGAPTPPATREVEVMGVVVAKLRPIERHIFDAEYVWCVGKDIGVKLVWLKKTRGIKVSNSQFKHKLMLVRERLAMGYDILF